MAQAQTVKSADRDSIRLEKISQMLIAVATTDSIWHSHIEISVGMMPLPELVRNVARMGGVNLGIKGADEIFATCNFSNAKITDLIYYLCKEYRLDLGVTGNIVSIFPAETVIETKIPQIHYSVTSGTLRYDLDNDPLSEIAKRISDVSNINLIVPEPLLSRRISGFVGEIPADDAIVALASTNGLRAVKDSNDIWRITVRDSLSSGLTHSYLNIFTENQLLVDSIGLITAHITAGDVQSIILELCNRMGFNYFFASPISQRTSIYVTEVDFETLLGVLLAGTQYSFYYESGIYIFGIGKGGTEGFGEGLISVKVIPMRYRSVNKVDELIPDQIKRDLQVKQFSDLNSIIICGDQRQIGRVEAFLKSIDHSVPLITIEVMIAEVTNKIFRESGITAGLGTATDGLQTYAPFNMTLNASTVNNLLNRFGPTNLGRVSNDFYLSIKALEEQGVLEIKSTPKLSTLNGHEALLVSGETQYYKEVINNIIGTQNPMQSESYTWKSVEANMMLRIVPFVSADSTITLDIEIEQGEFTAREEKTAPPGIATRSFKSQIRVRNEEMVLLGGIDRSVRERNSTGLPFIVRVPVLRWIFGTTRKDKSDYKLTLFIKPTLEM